MKFKFLVKNQSNKDRAVRLIISIFLIPIPLVLGENLITMFLGCLGVGLLFNSLTGNCYAYRLFGLSTCKIPKK